MGYPKRFIVDRIEKMLNSQVHTLKQFQYHHRKHGQTQQPSPHGGAQI